MLYVFCSPAMTILLSCVALWTPSRFASISQNARKGDQKVKDKVFEGGSKVSDEIDGCYYCSCSCTTIDVRWSCRSSTASGSPGLGSPSGR
uniref:Putative secreted peptide n=1 Tax=Anopheles braziliensis TaxID=58242 RepID=A0A2M3ZRC6_9DIPT